jgi:transposase
MDIHQNARLTPRSRAELVRRVLLEGQAPKAVATALGVNVKTVSKWCARCQAEGAAGLLDRSSRPLLQFHNKSKLKMCLSRVCVVVVNIQLH